MTNPIPAILTTYSECDEVAETTGAALAKSERPRTFDEALALVRRHMPNESETITDNVAAGLLARWRI
jgi:hypothetical protein